MFANLPEIVSGAVPKMSDQSTIAQSNASSHSYYLGSNPGSRTAYRAQIFSNGLNKISGTNSTFSETDNMSSQMHSTVSQLTLTTRSSFTSRSSSSSSSSTATNNNDIDLKKKLFNAFLNRSPGSGSHHNRKRSGVAVSVAPKKKKIQADMQHGFTGFAPQEILSSMENMRLGKNKIHEDSFNSQSQKVSFEKNAHLKENSEAFFRVCENGNFSKPFPKYSRRSLVSSLGKIGHHRLVNDFNEMSSFSENSWSENDPNQLQSFTVDHDTLTDESHYGQNSYYELKGKGKGKHRKPLSSTHSNAMSICDEDLPSRRKNYNRSTKKEKGSGTFRKGSKLKAGSIVSNEDAKKNLNVLLKDSKTHSNMNSSLELIGFLPCPSAENPELEGGDNIVEGARGIICQKRNCICNCYQVIKPNDPESLRSLRQSGPDNDDEVNNSKNDDNVYTMTKYNSIAIDSQGMSVPVVSMAQEVHRYLVFLVNSSSQDDWKCDECKAKKEALISCSYLLESIELDEHNEEMPIGDFQINDDSFLSSDDSFHNDCVSEIVLKVMKTTGEAEKCGKCLKNLRGYAKTHISEANGYTFVEDTQMVGSEVDASPGMLEQEDDFTLVNYYNDNETVYDSVLETEQHAFGHAQPVEIGYSQSSVVGFPTRLTDSLLSECDIENSILTPSLSSLSSFSLIDERNENVIEYHTAALPSSEYVNGTIDFEKMDCDLVMLDDKVLIQTDDGLLSN